ncbi:MAG: cyclic nucleotide-binding domain-containing protein [Bacteroidota bacterium]
MNRQEIAKALRQSPLFEELDESALHYIAKKAKTRQYFPNDVIVWQGKDSDSLFLITNGIVVIKRVSGTEEHTLAYLMPGNTFGEVGLLENKPRSANVVAMSDVDCLVIQRDEFFDIMHRYPGVAIAMAKMLGHYLVEMNRRQSRANKQAKVILIFDTFHGAGATSIGLSFTKLLAEKTEKRTVYTEYPAPQQLKSELKIPQKLNTNLYKAETFDILISPNNSFLPTTARTTLMIDNLMNDYTNIIITINGSLNGMIDKNIEIMLDYANQVVIIMPPIEEHWTAYESIKKEIKKFIRPNETSIFTLVSRSEESLSNMDVKHKYDFEIPFIADFPSLELTIRKDIQPPEAILDVVDMCIDRLERTHQIAVFIPTTVDVSQEIDTSEYVERTTKFLAERFGGATSTQQADGVWNSEDEGLVGEKVFIVHTYVTQTDMNKYLDEVIEFVKILKQELRQEAMALEVNKKLTLI